MKKTQFRIGLLTACLIGANSAFCHIATAQSCGAESCDSTSCKCSKKHCNDSGLLDVINSAASNFEAGLASMIPDGQKRKAKPTCGCSKCSTAASELTYSTPMLPPTVYEKEHIHSHTPHTASPVNPSNDRVPAPKPSHTPTQAPPPIPATIPVPIPDAHNNPFTDEQTGNNRPIQTRPASLLRNSNGSSVEYDPQARSYKPMRSIMAVQAATKSVSDLPNGLATTSSTRRATPMLTDRDASNQVAANQLRNSMHSEQSSDRRGQQTRNLESDAFADSTLASAAPEVVPASINTPVRNLRELRPSPESANLSRPPATVPTELYVNPLRSQ